MSSGNGLVNQLYAEVLGAVSGNARVRQLYAEALGGVAENARLRQLYAEVLGLYGSAGPAHARLDQLYAEVLGLYGTPDPCALPFPIIFTGNVSGEFYVMRETGSETVPIRYVDTTVTLSTTVGAPVTQTITQDGQWCEWLPNSGALNVAFANGVPVQFLWVVTSGVNQMPPVVPVWASSQPFSLWKQSCGLD